MAAEIEFVFPLSDLASIRPPRFPPTSSVVGPDYEGLSPAHAGAAARPRGLHQLHPVAVAHPRRHRLLHLQGLVAGLHGELDAGPAGLSWRWLHHRAPIPHQHRDVPGHESQVNMPAVIKLILAGETLAQLRPVGQLRRSRLGQLAC